MADNGNGKNRKRGSAGSKVPAAKRGKKKQQYSDSDSDNSSPPSPSQQPPLPPIEDEPAPKLPEELLKTYYTEPGVLLIAGLVSWDKTGKRPDKVQNSHPNLNVFHKFTDRKYRLVASGCTSAHSVVVSEEGKAYTFGRNTNGQLGLGDTNVRNEPTEVTGLADKNIIQAATGRNHTLFLTDSGIVYACGDNRSGQCGVGNNTPQLLTPTRIYYRGAPIVRVGCGAEFSMILDCNGGLHSFGLPEYGQLGHNTDGKYFVTSTKLSYHFETAPKRIILFIEKSKDGHINPCENVEIVNFSCGNNHSVAIDSKKRAFSWGFGGFGRLGHAEQKDESVPRLIKYFDSAGRGIRSVHCGSTYSLAVNENGGLFLFGQTKRSGEANMYPKPVQDLTGWNIRHVGTSTTSIVIAADESLIAWGPAPTYGELGTGDLQRSSTKPMEVNRMDGMKISQVAMGFSHTLLLCDDSTDQVKEKLSKMPTFDP